LPKGTAFTAQRRHQPVLIGTLRIGCSGPNRTAYLVVMSHASCKCSTLRQRVRGFQLTRLRRSTSVLAQNWRKPDVSIAMPFGTHPLRTETGGRSG